MKTATLAIVLDGEDVLLAEKKVGEIGTGVLSGPGGKLEPGESLLECLTREMKEEWDIEPYSESIKQVAHIIFYAKGEPDFDVHVYLVTRFTGTLKETSDAKMPERHPLHLLPFSRMYDGDQHWLPRAARGERFFAHVHYKERAKEFERIEFLPPDFLLK